MTKLIIAALAALLIATPALAKNKGGGGSGRTPTVAASGYISWHWNKAGKDQVGKPFTLSGINGKIVGTVHKYGGGTTWIAKTGKTGFQFHDAEVYRRTHSVNGMTR